MVIFINFFTSEHCALTVCICIFFCQKVIQKHINSDKHTIREMTVCFRVYLCVGACECACGICVCVYICVFMCVCVVCVVYAELEKESEKICTKMTLWNNLEE